MLVLDKICKTYKSGRFITTKFEALKDLNVTFYDKTFNLIVGESGSGKSTLLNIISGLDYPTSGKMFFDDVEITKKNLDAFRNSEIGYVSQEFNIIENISLKDNLKLCFDLAKKKFTLEAAEEVLKKANLPDDDDIETFLTKTSDELSYGQMQRFAIARALINDPKLLILDEPTSSLDSENTIKILDLLKSLSKDVTIIVSSHETKLYEEYADNIYLIKNKNATVVKETSRNKEEKIEGNKKFRKGFISYFESLKIAFKNIFNHYVRLINSSIVTILIMCLFSCLYSLAVADFTTVIMRSGYSNNNDGLFLTAVRENDEYSISTFNEETLNKITDYSDGKLAYCFGNGSNLSELSTFNSSSVYGRYLFCNSLAIEFYDESTIDKLGITKFSKVSNEVENRMPTNYEEVAITDIYAEGIKQYGLIDSATKEIIHFNSYDEIIGKKIGNLTISGIFSCNDGSYETISPYFNKTEDSVYDTYENGIVNNFEMGKSVFLAKGFNAHNNLYDLEIRQIYCELTGDLEQDRAFIDSLKRDGNKVMVSNAYSTFAHPIILIDGFIENLLFGVSCALIVISFLLSLNYIFATTSSMQKDLGIIKSIGSSKFSLFSICVNQGLIFGLANSILVFGIDALAFYLLNDYCCISLFSFNLFSSLVIISILILITALLSLFASIKVAYMKPLSSINEEW